MPRKNKKDKTKKEKEAEEQQRRRDRSRDKANSMMGHNIAGERDNQGYVHEDDVVIDFNSDAPGPSSAPDTRPPESEMSRAAISDNLPVGEPRVHGRTSTFIPEPSPDPQHLVPVKMKTRLGKVGDNIGKACCGTPADEAPRMNVPKNPLEKPNLSKFQKTKPATALASCSAGAALKVASAIPAAVQLQERPGYRFQPVVAMSRLRSRSQPELMEQDEPGPSGIQSPASSRNRPGSSRNQPPSDEDQPGPSRIEQPVTSRDQPRASRSRLGSLRTQSSTESDPGTSRSRNRPGSGKKQQKAAEDEPGPSRIQPETSRSRSSRKPISSEAQPGPWTQRPTTSRPPRLAPITGVPGNHSSMFRAEPLRLRTRSVARGSREEEAIEMRPMGQSAATAHTTTATTTTTTSTATTTTATSSSSTREPTVIIVQPSKKPPPTYGSIVGYLMVDAEEEKVTHELIKQNPIEDYLAQQALLDKLTSPVYDAQKSLSRHAYHAMSTVLSVVTTQFKSVENGKALAEKLKEQLVAGSSNESVKLFALASLGELGRRFPQIYENSSIQPEQLALSAFESPSEELKATAAHALGALAVGNLPKYLPFILEQIRSSPKRQYLLLHALKEVIVWESTEATSTELFRSAIGDIWQLLMASAAGGPEDGARSVVAECLGRLCAYDPATLLPELKQHVTSPDTAVRSAVVSAVKYMINDSPKTIDHVLQKSIGTFLDAVKDSELSVRRVALIVLNSAAHNKPQLIRDLLPELLPSVYAETHLRKELIREVEMGPFKHQIDDGLELRKCAFECMYTLLEYCGEKVDMAEFITVMEAGLKDQSHDVKLLNYLTLQRISNIAPGLVLQRLDKICEPLKTQLTIRPRSNAVKQELEKLEELKKSAIRVVYTLKRLPDIERQQVFGELYNTIKCTKELQEMADQVVSESRAAAVFDPISRDSPMEVSN